MAELKYSEAFIYGATGKVPIYFRPPFEDIADRVRAIVNALGYRSVIWSKDSLDTNATEATQSNSVNIITSWFAASPGFVTLQHDISPLAIKIAINALNTINKPNPLVVKPQAIGTCQGLSNDQWYKLSTAPPPGGTNGTGTNGSSISQAGSSSSIGTGAIIGIVIAAFVVFIAIFGLIWCSRRKGQEPPQYSQSSMYQQPTHYQSTPYQPAQYQQPSAYQSTPSQSAYTAPSTQYVQPPSQIYSMPTFGALDSNSQVIGSNSSPSIAVGSPSIPFNSPPIYSESTTSSLTRFRSMAEFYQLLSSEAGVDEDGVESVRRVFTAQMINPRILHKLTDETLKEMGIAQVGIRVAILSLL